MRLYILAYRTMLQHITNMLNGIPQTMLAIMFLSRTEAIKAISMVKKSMPLINAFIICSVCLTLKVSRDHTWREACASRIRDMYGRWLYCLVRLSHSVHNVKIS